MAKSKTHTFDGGAATYFGVGILAVLITVCTLGIGVPWAIVVKHSWRAKHTYINGHQMIFTGTGGGLFVNWIKWWVFMIITLGIYSFWVIPRLTGWIVEHTDFDPNYQPVVGAPAQAAQLEAPTSPPINIESMSVEQREI